MLLINGKLPAAYPLQGLYSGLTLPQGAYHGTFLPGKNIDLTIDPSVLGLTRAAFSIDTGDGHVFDHTIHVTHAYAQSGSYLVKVRVNEDTGQEDAQGNVDSCLLTVTPTADYRLPHPLISINGNVVYDNAEHPYTLIVGAAARFAAAASRFGTAPIVKYQWDFGDENLGEGLAVTHVYDDPARYLYVILRATDANGVFADTFITINLDDKAGQLPGNISDRKQGTQSSIKRRFDQFYASSNIWMRQTLLHFGGGGAIPVRAMLLIFLVAIGLGALHSLTPGHSKSIMAAILIGKDDSRLKDVLVLASSITFTHTALIYALGLLLLVFDKTITLQRIMPYFTRLNIVLVIALGGWLIARGMRAWLQHRGHHAHEHEHGHGHGHAGDSPVHAHMHVHHHHDGQRADSLWGMILAGASGGLMPCLDALSILLLAVSLHRVLFGLAIILFFSLGLALSIVVLGVLVIRTKRLINIEARVGDTIGIYAPLLTGVVIMLLGLRLLL